MKNFLSCHCEKRSDEAISNKGDCRVPQSGTRNDNTRGQSLVEVVVVVGMVVLMVAGLVAGTTSSLRYSQNTQYKSKALKYSQEGIELTRKLRDSGWSTFQAKAGTWCVDGSAVWTDAAGNPCPKDINSVYSRTITLTWDGSTKMTAEVAVGWSDGTTTHTSTLTTIFTEWK